MRPTTRQSFAQRSRAAFDGAAIAASRGGITALGLERTAHALATFVMVPGAASFFPVYHGRGVASSPMGRMAWREGVSASLAPTGDGSA